jgi:hypothetical protein
MLNVFKIKEGVDDTIVDGTTSTGTTIDGTNNVGTPIDGTTNAGLNVGTYNPINTSLISENDFIKQINQFGYDTPLTDASQQLNHNLHTIYSINKDLSNNVYRKSDSVKDIYDTSGNNLLNTILSHLAGLSTKIDDMKKEETTIEDIKCIADFGTNIGDSLCCGQSGVLTDTKYVCPANYSKCESMKCGSKYGKCVKPT